MSAVMDDRWQPISTAPKDGTFILAFDGEVRVMIWSLFFRRGWISGNADEREPTHWMPLPEPPRA